MCRIEKMGKYKPCGMNLSDTAVKMMMHLGKVNAWEYWNDNPLVFRKDASTKLCAELEHVASELSCSLFSDENANGSDSKDPYLDKLLKKALIEQIENFLSFCKGGVFWIYLDCQT
jgi:hypothetical protein